MPYLPEYNLLFVHIPKCAGTSVEKWMGRIGSMSLRDEPIPHDWSPLSESSKHHVKCMHLSYLDQLRLLNIDRSSVISFTVVRNPYAKVLSHFRFMRKNHAHQNVERPHWKLAVDSESFQTFVSNLANRKELWPVYSSKDYLLNENGNIGVSSVLKMENLGYDFLKIKSRILLNSPLRGMLKLHHILKPLPLSNKLESYNWNEFYSRKTADTVYEIFREDFEYFHYPRIAF